MPVTTRRTGLHRALSPATVERSTEATARVVAKHRKPKSVTAPRAAAAMTLSVGLAVSAGAGLNTDTAQAKASKTATAGQIRGNTPAYKKPPLRFGDSGRTVSYVQYRLAIPRTGWYGRATVQAVGNFQRSIKLPRTGTMTKRTWNAFDYLARHPKKRSAFHARVLKEAAKLRGTPYRYGGTSPRGFDCSGYTGYVYKKAGKKIPRTSRAQYAATRHLSRRTAKPGDLVFFKNGSGRVYHVGIFAGGNMLWHSSKPGVPVRKAKIWSKRVAFGRA